MALQTKEKFKRALVLSAFVLFGMVLLSATIGFFASGFDTATILDLFQTYGVFGMAGIMVTMFVITWEILTPKDDNKYGDSVGFSEGIIPFKFAEDRLLLMFGSFIVFGFLGLFVTLQGQSFTGEVLTSQQFTPTGEVLFRFLLIPLAENAQLAGVLAISFFVLRRVARKTKMARGAFLVLFFIVSIFASAVTGVANHELRYGDTDLALTKVVVFWGLTGALNAMFGFVPGSVMHATNNGLIDIQNFFSNDFVPIVIWIVFISISLFFLIMVFRRNKRKKNGI